VGGWVVDVKLALTASLCRRVPALITSQHSKRAPSAPLLTHDPQLLAGSCCGGGELAGSPRPLAPVTHRSSVNSMRRSCCQPTRAAPSRPAHVGVEGASCSRGEGKR
jgi:hypothetical protein